MNIIKLTSERKLNFIEYCKRYRDEFDDSFLDDEELGKFEPNDENPTYILLENNRINGAVSLVVDAYYKKAGTGRFRIFHSIKKDEKIYAEMFRAILKSTGGLQKVFMFVQGEDQRLQGVLQELNFKVKRYSYVLIMDNLDYSNVDFPKGYELREFKAGRDESNWCNVRNLGFASLEGSKTAKTPEMFDGMENDYGHINGGLMMLYYKGVPVGQVRGSKEEDDGEDYVFISSLCVIPEHQGKGLGRKLLRAALNFGKDKGFEKGMLTVNAENEGAVSLYLNEGFHKDMVMVCYEYSLDSIEE